MEKYYSSYTNKSVSISFREPFKKDKRKNVVRGVYDIETNNDLGLFVVGGLALHNGNDSEIVSENYNISFHNKPYLILYEIYNHNKKLGGNNIYEIAVHNLMFDIQSFLYNILEEEKITYKEPSGYGKQDKNTYSIVMNDRKQIFSCTVNYCGITILFWDTFKLYPASLKKLCEVYQLKNAKIDAGDETYNSESFEDFCKNEINVDYLIHDLLSVAELVDRNYYKKKTASGNAWNNMKDEICTNLGLRKKSDNAIKTIIEFWGDNRLNDYCLPGYSGGFCYANPKRAGEIITNVLHLDINSSYPNAMANLELPLTHYTSKQIETDRYLIYVSAEFNLKENSFPIIKSRQYQNEYLKYYKGDILFTDIEWERVQKNYNIYKLKIIEVMNFPKTDKILRSFVLKNYEMKQNSTGFLREKAKLNLNSAYGKLAEHHDGQLYQAYINDYGIVSFKLSENTINLITTEKSRNVIWAMFITSFAREKLYRCIDVLGDNFIYTDTDSIFTDLKEEEVIKRFTEIGEEVHDKNLGAWAIEGHSPLFKTLRAKCYLKTDEDKENVHRLNYVVAGYNGEELLKGFKNAPVREIGGANLKQIFDNFKIGMVLHDKETSIVGKYGIRKVKVLTDFEIREKITNFNF